MTLTTKLIYISVQIMTYDSFQLGCAHDEVIPLRIKNSFGRAALVLTDPPFGILKGADHDSVTKEDMTVCKPYKCVHFLTDGR